MSTPPWTATNSAGYAAPVALAVDAVVLTVRDHELVALVVEDATGATALPGGLVAAGERPEATLRRKLGEKTGLRRLYVCLTRAVTSLVVVHALPLPPELGSPDL